MLAITGNQRTGLAYLFAMHWSGSVEDLIGLERAFTALKMGDVMKLAKYNAAGGLSFDDGAPDLEVELSEETARLLLRFYPTAQTPWPYGRGKAKFLQALQSSLPAPPEE